jgi:hypothetical protein
VPFGALLLRPFRSPIFIPLWKSGRFWLSLVAFGYFQPPVEFGLALRRANISLQVIAGNHK